MLFKSLKVTTDFKLEIKHYLLRYKTQHTKCNKCIISGIGCLEQKKNKLFRFKTSQLKNMFLVKL